MQYSENVIKVYEEYILAAPNERDNIISKLTKGSTHYKILKALHTLNSPNPTTQDQAFLEEVIKEIDQEEERSEHPDLSKIWSRFKMAQYFKEPNDQKLNIIKEFLKRKEGIDFNDFKKPLQADSIGEDRNSGITSFIDDSEYSDEAIKNKIASKSSTKTKLTEVFEWYSLDW